MRANRLRIAGLAGSKMAVSLKTQIINGNVPKIWLQMDIVKVFAPGEFLVRISPDISRDEEAKACENLKNLLRRRLKSVLKEGISQHLSGEGEIVAVHQDDDGEWRPFCHMRYNQTARGTVPEGLFLDT